MIKKKGPAIFSAAIYFVLAKIIRDLPDEAMRKVVADHFATEFNKRSNSFDVCSWERATGGRPAPGSSCEENRSALNAARIKAAKVA